MVHERHRFHEQQPGQIRARRVATGYGIHEQALWT